MSELNLNIDDLKKLASVIEQQNLPQPQLPIPDIKPEIKSVLETELPKPAIQTIPQNKKVSFSTPNQMASQTANQMANQTVNQMASQTASQPANQMASQPASQTNIIKIIPDSFNLCGVILPKHTLYLTISLVFVGIIIWYMSKDKQKEKINNVEKEKN